MFALIIDCVIKWRIYVMMTFDYDRGEGVQNGSKVDDVIYEWPLAFAIEKTFKRLNKSKYVGVPMNALK